MIIEELVKSKITASHILSKSELREFANLYLRDIAIYYPLSSEYSATSYIEGHLNLDFKQQLSTLNKTIWKAMEGNKIVGFTVVTEKDGRAIKFGPTIIKRRYRGKGKAAELRLLLESIYSERGFYFSYSTTNNLTDSVIKYAQKANSFPSIKLGSHFHPGINEIVLSKKIKEFNNKSGYKKQNWDYLEINDIYDINNFDDFLDYSSSSKNYKLRKNESEILSRIFIPITNNGNSILLIPKKGNSVQLVPVFLRLDKDEISKILDVSVQLVKNLFGRIYLYLPAHSPFVSIFEELSFSNEGQFSKIIRGSIVGLSILAKKI